MLIGGAMDNQDGFVADTGLRWHSNRDGFLGTGSHLNTALSAGPHVLTLEATNRAGLVRSSTASIMVEGD